MIELKGYRLSFQAENSTPVHGAETYDSITSAKTELRRLGAGSIIVWAEIKDESNAVVATWQELKPLCSAR